MGGIGTVRIGEVTGVLEVISGGIGDVVITMYMVELDKLGLGLVPHD